MKPVKPVAATLVAELVPVWEVAAPELLLVPLLCIVCHCLQEYTVEITHVGAEDPLEEPECAAEEPLDAAEDAAEETAEAADEAAEAAEESVALAGAEEPEAALVAALSVDAGAEEPLVVKQLESAIINNICKKNWRIKA